jgi:hypothetical protein
MQETGETIIYMFVLYTGKNLMSGGKALEGAQNLRQPKEKFWELEKKSVRFIKP